MLTLAIVLGSVVYLYIDMYYGFAVGIVLASIGWYWKEISESVEDIPEAKKKDDDDDDVFELGMNDDTEDTNDNNDELTLEDL